MAMSSAQSYTYDGNRLSGFSISDRAHRLLTEVLSIHSPFRRKALVRTATADLCPPHSEIDPKRRRASHLRCTLLLSSMASRPRRLSRAIMVEPLGRNTAPRSPASATRQQRILPRPAVVCLPMKFRNRPSIHIARRLSTLTRPTRKTPMRSASPSTRF